jgi:hypothetical protein
VETRPLARRRAAPASDEGGLRTATATATREPLPRPQTASSDAAISAAIEELDLLAEALRNGGAPHIDQLMRLIDVLRRQLSANPPKMSEANQGWAQFADYATKYLSNIAGVMARVESIGRILGR